MKRSSEALRVCVDARMVSGQYGGVEQIIIGLASGFSMLTDGSEEYLFLTYADATEWIRPYVAGPCRILRGPAVPRTPRWRQLLDSNVPLARDTWHRLSPIIGSRTIKVPRSDGTIEKADVDIMVFTIQTGFLTEVPSIYHPYDLQHVHLPEFFTRRELLYREVLFRTFCEQAQMVNALSSWGKRDLIRHYELPEDKVQVVPWAPVLTAYPTPSDDDLALVKEKFSLPEAFVFYPAQTWAHKNHLGLLEALTILRERHDSKIPFVSSGRLNEFYPTIQRRVRKLRLTDQVQFLGFVTPLELHCLYRLCRSMVFPSKFEGWGLPITEAFLTGVPVACSNVTLLPDLAGDAALIFDPDRTDEIADAVFRVWTDEALRKLLIERGKKSLARFSWDRTARTLRAHLRRIASRPLTEEDRVLLTAPPLI
jgi:glycosyltransferase involved in cell wall biosynthesis